MSFPKAALTSAALGVAVGLALTSAFAQGPGGGAMRFEQMDTNSDNRVSSEEHAAWAESVFATMDADKSGDLTETEYMAVRMGPGPRAGSPGPRHAERQARKKERFKTMDADGDGKVSKEQFLANSADRFAASDANKDGMLTFDEFREAHW